VKGRHINLDWDNSGDRLVMFLCSMPVVPGVEKPRVLELNKEERAQLELAWAAHLHVYYPLGPRHKQPTSRLCQLMKAMVIEHRTSLRDLQERNNMQLKLIFERYGFNQSLPSLTPEILIKYVTKQTGTLESI
jgi:hypothetical protein